MARMIILLKGMGMLAFALSIAGCTPANHYYHPRTEIVIIEVPDVHACPEPAPYPYLPTPHVKEPPRQDRTPDVPTRTKTGTQQRKAPKQPVQGRGKR